MHVVYKKTDVSEEYMASSGSKSKASAGQEETSGKQSTQCYDPNRIAFSFFRTYLRRQVVNLVITEFTPVTWDPDTAVTTRLS